jgi:hypothetical protein
MRTELEQHATRMRERAEEAARLAGAASAQPLTAGQVDRLQRGLGGQKPVEQHYSVQEVADALHLSEKTIRRYFEDEPGVIKLSPRKNRGGRTRFVLRIPQSVLNRWVRRMSA